jgi:hypothetical protein
MSTVSVNGLGSVKELLAGLGGELQKANELSQNKMAYELWGAERRAAKSDLDRPTPWTLSSIVYKKFGAKQFTVKNKAGDPIFVRTPGIEGAGVFVVDKFERDRSDAEHYLGVQTLGGVTAGPRRSETALQMRGWMPKGKIWVPAVGTRLDRYGNVPGSLISAMLSNLGANPYGQGQPGNVEEKYVLVGPRGDEEGVFQKVRGEWRPFLWFVSRETYQSRFDFYGTADKEIQLKFQGILAGYVNKAIEKAGKA